MLKLRLNHQIVFFNRLTLRLVAGVLAGLLVSMTAGQLGAANAPAEHSQDAAAGKKPDDQKNRSGAPQSAKTKDEAKADSKELGDKISVTKGSVTIQGYEIKYQATAGTIVLKNEKDDKPSASVFFVAYTRTGATNLDRRPITFSFNGGPGSSSVWLHLGLLGPRRVFLNDDGSLPPPPFRLVNNDYSLLDESDLVFIDPVSTGFSRAAPGEDPGKFHGVDQDIESVADFIRLYTTRYNRWLSPKFLIGESYGTTRAAGLSGHLENRYGLYLNGIMLVSSVLDFQTLSFNPGNDLPYALYLPSETAAAWYHKKLAPDLQADLKKTLGEAEEFALGDYSRALLQGSTLPDAERKIMVAHLARLTGLTPDYVDRANLRVNVFHFFKELLLAERQTIGRYDSRRLGQDLNSVEDSPEYDPSYTSVQGPFTAGLNDYVRRELKFKSDLPYEILTGKVSPWDFGNAKNRYLDVADTLRQAMTHNPYLKVFVANGYFDLATPYLATKYTFDHMGLPANLRTNVSMGYYPSGHMIYTDKPSLVQLKGDLAKFIESATPPAK